MKEIGGYFELDQFVKKPYHDHMIELNTGRNALIYLIKAKSIKKIYLPRYLCDSVSDVLDRLSVEYEYYLIDKDFYPQFHKKLNKDEYLYVVNYYGQINDMDLISLKERFETIIVDNTQSFFQKPITGIDTIYSLRKYFGLPDGAYLSTDMKLKEKLEEEKSSIRMKHILGRFEGKASTYYSDFRENDASFKKLSLKNMSKLTQNILGAIDYEEVRILRNKNFLYLHEGLGISNALNISVPEGPFSYPYYVENGTEVRKSLAERKIYIPTLWPNVLKNNEIRSVEYDYAANILPIPCDQRYVMEDMDRIIKELKMCIG